ncbi:MAG: BtpA/SgcQ family protein [Phycisphaerales bacterium]
MPHVSPLPPRALIGMIHVGATPGAPGSRKSIPELAKDAAAEAAMYVQAGFDGVMIENMHDTPYVHGRQSPEVVVAMTACGIAVQNELARARTRSRPLPLGVQVLSGGNHEALAVALGCGARFIRCENFVFAHVGDEGLMPIAEAGPLLRYRRAIGAEGVAVYADVKKKHASHALTADLSIAEAAAGAVFFGADGLIVTGVATGKATELTDVEAVREEAGNRPVLVGSGANPGNVSGYLAVAAGVIVGSACKRGGDWRNHLDRKRLDAIRRAAN